VASDGLVVEIGSKEVEERLAHDIVKATKEGSPEKYIVFKYLARVKIITQDGLLIK